MAGVGQKQAFGGECGEYQENLTPSPYKPLTEVRK